MDGCHVRVAESVHLPKVLAVVDIVVKEQFAHLEKGESR